LLRSDVVTYENGGHYGGWFDMEIIKYGDQTAAGCNEGNSCSEHGFQLSRAAL